MEIKDKRVGVFMQLYRNEPSMHKAIQSVLEQTYTNFKYYILVSEKTESEVMKYAEKDTRITVWKKESQKDYNFYIKELAKDDNDYITVIDADDWYSKKYIEMLLTYAEKHQTDITACGYYFVNDCGEMIEERKALGLAWDTMYTNQVLPYMYAFFRTIWGKLITREVIEKFSVQKLIPNECCGGYGTDTTFMFNLFRDAKRVGICEESLYYYRISKTGGSYVWKQGREESDELLFNYVHNVLEEISTIGENERRFLLHVYGNAVIDTVRLLLTIKMTENERVGKIRYVLEKVPTEELLQRERKDMLVMQQIEKQESYQKRLYELIFREKSRCIATGKTTEEYLRIFELLYPNRKGTLNAEEFFLLLHGEGMLDLFVKDQYNLLFDKLLDELRYIKHPKVRTCLQLLRRVTKEPLVKSLLEEKKFVLVYENIILKVNNQEKEEALIEIQRCFANNDMPYEAKRLINLWINLAALLENASGFIIGKELEVEILLRLGDTEEARKKYEELKELGISDDNMSYLGGCLNI